MQHHAALRRRLGSTEYFIIAMKAKELVEKAITPSKIEGWDSMTLEEREQRDINYARVKNQIAPYLANDKDRFFGAIILTAKNFDPNNFEPIGKIASKGMHKLYQEQAQSMGFLTFTGGEVLIPLDGQHRLKAIQFAIEGRDEKNQEIPGMSPSSELANEDVTVIIVPYDAKKSRKIFTKINRYAKSTTGQNLVTDDDDFVAVSARHVANNLISPDLVKCTSSTLTNKDPYFTTLATIAACNEVILRESFPPIDRTQPVIDPDLKSLLGDKIEEVWECLLENIEEFSVMLSDKTEYGNRIRREIREDCLLGKPMPQLCLVRAFIKMINSNKFSPQKACTQLNKINWRKSAELWDGLLISGGGRLLYKNKKIAVDIIYYICGGKCDEEKLLAEYRKLFSTGNSKQLPLKV